MMPLKMASLTGASNRNTYLVTAVAMLISVPPDPDLEDLDRQCIRRSVLIGSFGACSIDKACSGWDWAPPLAPLVSYGAIGFVITFALAILHATIRLVPIRTARVRNRYIGIRVTGTACGLHSCSHGCSRRSY